ncbi:MAG: 16S rRNA (guanine(527)-N(7))-methyltransferase RsmG [Chitinophagales bacterium]|nr:16S rRNA (guanine(527)-N(7))-methyltransferase RsmG [Chitinophagaceae bacterium]MCB9066054.1 16S rRNA (guanine(527)-N(7))-methyltransferase RsmG [Chitinophagales bacterium]
MDIIQKYFDDFTDKQTEQLAALADLYRDWNEKINVISRKDIDTLYERHVLHSMAIAAMCEMNPGAKVIDIGTGGGFPGIPLAIFYPEVDFLLVDSIGKKIKVVNAVSEAIGLKNVRAVHSRVEEIRNEQFDYAVSRAVAPLKDLWWWVNPVIRKGNTAGELPNGLMCLKGGNLEQEMKESKLNVRAWSVQDIFQEPFFEEKFLLYVPK